MFQMEADVTIACASVHPSQQIQRKSTKNRALSPIFVDFLQDTRYSAKNRTPLNSFILFFRQPEKPCTKNLMKAMVCG